MCDVTIVQKKSFDRLLVSLTTLDFESYLYINFNTLFSKNSNISIKKREFIQILTLDLLLKDRSFKFNKDSLYLCNSLVTCIVKKKEKENLSIIE